MLCRFHLDELRQACSEVADVDMTLQQSTCQTVDSLAEINQTSDELGDDTEIINDKDEEIVSEDELEELHEFLLTQRQRNSDSHMLQSATAQEHLTSDDEGGSESESAEDDMRDLSQALLRKLEESFAAEPEQDENRISSIAVEENAEICEKSNDLPSSVYTCGSDQLIMAVLDSDTVGVNDVNSASDTKLPSSEVYEGDKVALHDKPEESLVAELVEDDKMDDQQIADGVHQDSKMCDKFKDIQMCVSVDNSDHLTSAELTETSMELNDINGLVTKMPASADACEDKLCSVDAVSNKQTSPGPSAGAQSRCYSAASPLSLFEESSLDQCNLERLNSDEDASASADDNGQMLEADFVDIDELINRCESPNDLFDSPSSHKSATSTAASPQAQSEACRRDNKTPPSSPKSTTSPVHSCQMQLDLQQGNQPPLSSQISATSPVTNLLTRLENLTEQGSQSRPAAPTVDLTDVIEVEEQLPPLSQKSASSPAEKLQTQSLTTASEVDLSDVIVLAEQPTDQLSSTAASNDEVTVLDSSAGHQPSASSESGIIKCCGLRKVRAKTRNTLTSDTANLPHYSSVHKSEASNDKSRQVYSDVEPDSDDDISKSRAVNTGMLPPTSCQALHSSSLGSIPSTKKCCVKLIRIDDAEPLPQVLKN